MLFSVPNGQNQTLELFKTGLSRMAVESLDVPSKLRGYVNEVLCQTRSLLTNELSINDVSVESLELALELKSLMYGMEGLDFFQSKDEIDLKKAANILNVIGG